MELECWPSHGTRRVWATVLWWAWWGQTRTLYPGGRLASGRSRSVRFGWTGPGSDPSLGTASGSWGPLEEAWKTTHLTLGMSQWPVIQVILWDHFKQVSLKLLEWWHIANPTVVYSFHNIKRSDNWIKTYPSLLLYPILTDLTAGVPQRRGVEVGGIWPHCSWGVSSAQLVHIMKNVFICCKKKNK